MNAPAHPTRRLTVALRALGLLFIVGFYPLTVLWPSGWTWHAGQSEYLQMIVALYANGAVMAVQSLANPHHIGHLSGDVPALFLVAAVLAWLCPSALTLRFASS